MQDLLELAIDRPAVARRRAEGILANAPSAVERSYAEQALGIVLRDTGRSEEAIQALRRAARAASRSGATNREPDVRATLGVALVQAGRVRTGLRELERAATHATGETAGKVALRYAAILVDLDRVAEAQPLLASAVESLERADNAVWSARARLWLAHAELRLGRVADAEQQVLAALTQLDPHGDTYDRRSALADLGDIAMARGDLPTALARYSQCVIGLEESDLPPSFENVQLLVSAYLSAGMATDAAELLDSATDPLGKLFDAERQVLLAEVLLAAGEADRASEAAARACSTFRRQGRSWSAQRARVARVRALFAAGRTGGLAREARAVAEALHRDRDRAAPLMLGMAGQLSPSASHGLWEAAATYRGHPHGLVRAAAHEARALAASGAGDKRSVLRAVSAGLAAIDEYRATIGSSELRALATTHGRDLTTIALRHAATDPRTLLRWSERTRATALAQPPATSDAATISASLAALRDNGRRLAEARAEGEPTDMLERERLRLERAVRSESHTLSATTAEQQKPPSVEEIVTAVGDGCLVELVDVDGTLHVLVTHAGRVRRKVAGSTEEIAALLNPTQMLLRRASRGRATDMSALGGQLQAAILGDAARLVPDGPVVLAPTARLHGLAWPLLPVLGDRPFSVVPSAGQWLRARATARPATARRRTVLVSGPGLATGGAEVPLLAASHPDATLLAGKEATLEQVMDRLDGADLVHLAAHGNFRADSPLFSALDLADGPLTVHDLERVRRAPYRVVLSACESGVLAPVGAEELLGLAAALFSLGTAGLVSSVAEVNDTATADLMVDLHASLAAGADPATALHRVRQQTAGDPVAAGTAAAFLALGV